MARVPGSGALPSVEQRPISPQYQSAAGATLDAFGGNSAAALQGAAALDKIADQTARIAIKNQIEDNEREAKSLDIEFSAELRKITYGDGTEQNKGYYGQSGENAIKGYADAEKAVAETKKRLMQRAANPKIREMFGQAADVRIESELRTMGRHLDGQRKIANDATSEARINEAADDAAAAWSDPKVLGRSAALAQSEVASMAERNGWAPEVTASKLQEAQSRVYRTAIMSALVQDPAAAQAIYDKNKDRIDGRLRPEIEKALEAGTLRQQSQLETARILGETPGDPKAQVDQAKKIKDPKVQDEVIQRLDQEHARSVRLQAEAEKKTRQDAWGVITKGGSVDDLTPQQLTLLEGTTLGAMREFETRRAKDGNGYAKASSPEAQNELHQLFMKDKLEFARTDLTKYLGKLTEQDYNKWQGLQRVADSKEERDKERNVSYSLGDRLANEYMRAAKIDPNKKGDNAGKAVVIRDRVRALIDRVHDEGKRATREDIEAELKGLFLSGEVDGSGFFSDKGKRFQFTDKQQRDFIPDDPIADKAGVASATQVPVSEIEPIVAALKKAKKPVTLGNIKKMYDRGQQVR